MINSIIESSFLSVLPISELRGGIPLAVYRGVSIFSAFLICVIANCFVIPIVFFFLDNLHELFMVNRLYKKIFNKYIEKKRSSIEKYIGTNWEFIALMSLVGIPLPITGAYTGTLLAWFFKIPRKRAYLSLILGILTAGLIVSLVVFCGITTLDIFIKNI